MTEWPPPTVHRDWTIQQVAWVLDTHVSTLGKWASKRNGVIATDSEGRPLIVARDLIGSDRRVGPGERRWSIPHADMVKAFGADITPPTGPLRAEKEKPMAYPSTTPPVRANLSTGSVKCEVRTPTALTPDQWAIVSALAESVQQAAALHDEEPRSRPRIVQR